MNEELKNTLKYLKNKNNTRRIKTITITEAQKVVEEIERLNNIINEIKEYFEDLEIFAPSRDIKYDILDIIKGSDKE